MNVAVSALARPRAEVGPFHPKYDQTPTWIGAGAGLVAGGIAGPLIALRQISSAGMHVSGGGKALTITAAAVLGASMGAALLSGAVDIVRHFIPDAK